MKIECVQCCQRILVGLEVCPYCGANQLHSSPHFKKFCKFKVSFLIPICLFFFIVSCGVFSLQFQKKTDNPSTSAVRVISSALSIAIAQPKPKNTLQLSNRIKFGEASEIKSDIERGISVDGIDGRYRRTAIMVAAHRGDQDLVLWLIAKGANLDSRDIEGNTALHYALGAQNSKSIPLRGNLLRPGQKEAAFLLIENNADFHFSNNNCLTPFKLAANVGELGIVKKLFEEGASLEAPKYENSYWYKRRYPCDNTTPLMEAARNGHNQVIEFLLSKGADINKTREKSDWWGSGCTALFYAVRNGQLETVEYLLSKGADPNLKDIPNSKYPSSGFTPLDYAQQSGKNKQIMTLLKQHGAKGWHELPP